jgi:hypothetical protein
VGYRRGTLICALLGVVLLAGCSAEVSHPSALGTAPAASPVASAPALSATISPVSPSRSDADSSSAVAVPPESPAISGTPTSTGSANISPMPADVVSQHARATAQAFIDDFNIALATGDTTKIESLTSPTCGCRKLVNTIKQMSVAGEHYRGVVFTAKSIDVGLLAAGASGDVKYSISAGSVVDATGKEVNTTTSTPDAETDLFIVSADGGWIVQQSILLGANNQ